jgi:raffinose/stachyose/melibiose transport system permease protein
MATVSTALPKRRATVPVRKPGAARSRVLLFADIVGLSPTLLLYGLFIVIPVFFAIFLSFTSWNVVGPLRWVGFSNWSRFFSDQGAHHALLVTFELVALSWLVETPLAMALGLFIAGRQRYRAVYAAIYLLPLLLSTAGIALMWEGLFSPDFGGLAWFSFHLHISFLNQNWLGDPSITLYVVVVIIAWQFVPFHALIYQAGRRSIPRELDEAARVDGATIAQTFRYITLPQLRYTIVTSSMLIIVGSLTYFDIIFILTQGGPGDTTRVLSLYMYDSGFLQTEFGYASVLAVVLAVIGIAVALLLIRVTGFGRMDSGREGIS